jgi:hypothetical protein
VLNVRVSTGDTCNSSSSASMHGPLAFHLPFIPTCF